ncbi:hypothetical protein ACFSL6_11780 [Paenibacillus thailandensis]|uniref:hypothetical protein n=1 Tax=Paenibacillus thailandensis TaxID=393250 RepID=UPI003632BA94
MNSELSKLTDSFVSPLLFIVMCLVVYLVAAMIVFYRLLPWIPSGLSKALVGLGLIGMFVWLTSNFNTISKLVEDFSSTQMIIGLFVLFIIVAVISALLSGNKKKARRYNFRPYSSSQK